MYYTRLCILFSYTVLITYLSLADDSSGAATIPDLNSFGILNLDKLAHFFAYMAYVCISIMVFGIRRSKQIAVILFAYGLTLEVLQTWVPHREPSLADFSANCGGIIFGIALMLVSSKMPRNRFIKTIIPDIERK